MTIDEPDADDLLNVLLNEIKSNETLSEELKDKLITLALKSSIQSYMLGRDIKLILEEEKKEKSDGM